MTPHAIPMRTMLPMRWMVRLPPRPESLGERLRALREARGLTQLALAADIGVGQTAISAYEVNRYSPPTETLRALAAYFGVSASELRTLRDRYRAWQEEFPRLPGPSLAIPDEPDVIAALEVLDGLTTDEMRKLAEMLRLRHDRPQASERPERDEQRPDRYDNRHAG